MVKESVTNFFLATECYLLPRISTEYCELQSLALYDANKLSIIFFPASAKKEYRSCWCNAHLLYHAVIFRESGKQMHKKDNKPLKREEAIFVSDFLTELVLNCWACSSDTGPCLTVPRTDKHTSQFFSGLKLDYPEIIRIKTWYFSLKNKCDISGTLRRISDRNGC